MPTTSTVSKVQVVRFYFACVLTVSEVQVVNFYYARHYSLGGDARGLARGDQQYIQFDEMNQGNRTRKIICKFFMKLDP